LRWPESCPATSCAKRPRARRGVVRNGFAAGDRLPQTDKYKGERMATDTNHAYDWQGLTLIDRNGDKIGKIDALYLDQQTAKAEWALVNTGLFGAESSLVPLAGASSRGDEVVAEVDAQQIEDAPKLAPDEELSEREEAELFRHYGIDYTTEGSVTAADGGTDAARDRGVVGRDVSGPTTDEAMTRSEEELRVGKAEQERGRARLRKYVVTERVQQMVPVQREKVRVEREPITDANVDQALEGPEIQPAPSSSESSSCHQKTAN
jgi:stress response protein YsnF